MGTYRKLVSRLLSRTLEDETSEHVASVSALREVLYKLANQYRAQDRKLSGEVLEMLMATHYQNMLHTTKALGLKELAAKCAVTLLKYPDYVAQDKAFYQAGMCCRDGGNINLSFLLLNRYVDLAEAIDVHDASFLDNSEFQEADAIPLQEALPAKHYLGSEVGNVQFGFCCLF